MSSVRKTFIIFQHILVFLLLIFIALSHVPRVFKVNDQVLKGFARGFARSSLSPTAAVWTAVVSSLALVSLLKGCFQ